MDWGILLGLIAVAVAIYFGLWGFRKDVSDKISDIRDKVMVVGNTLDKAWDLMKIHYGASTGTVVRNLPNLGNIKVSAEPGPKNTMYIIEVEKPIFQEALLLKISRETQLGDKEKEIFGKEPQIGLTVFSPTRMRLTLPCTEPKICTDYITVVLKWLDSEYFTAIPEIKDFEENILI